MITNCLDLPLDGHTLTPEEYKAVIQTELYLTVAHMKGLNSSDIPAGDQNLDLIIPGASASGKSGAELKANLLNRIDKAFDERANYENKQKYHDTWRKQFDDNMEDPALLRNFNFFDIPNSDAMLLFYISVWGGNMAMAMEYLHNEAPKFKTKNLAGADYVPGEGDSWAHMSHYEGMAKNERAKANFLTDEFNNIYEKSGEAPKVLALGAGNLPERFYNIPKIVYTAFDTSLNVLSPEELFAGDDEVNTFNREHCTYLHEDLANALKTKPELIGTQDFMTLMGCSMYLSDEQLAGVMNMAKMLLKNGGKLIMDFLILTDSVRRIGAQKWPVNPSNMHITTNLEDAKKRVEAIVATVNGTGKTFKLVKNQVNHFEPWGDQSYIVELSLEA